MTTNRITQAMVHLRGRLEQSAGVIATEIRRGAFDGELLYVNIVCVPTVWRRKRAESDNTPVSGSTKVWLISTTTVPVMLKEADFLKISGKWYRISKDDIDEQVFQYHGEHELMRAYNSVFWGT